MLFACNVSKNESKNSYKNFLTSLLSNYFILKLRWHPLSFVAIHIHFCTLIQIIYKGILCTYHCICKQFIRCELFERKFHWYLRFSSASTLLKALDCLRMQMTTTKYITMKKETPTK